MNYAKLLENKNAVVTCADCDAGRAIARLFAEHGANVAMGSANPAAGEFLLGERSFVVPCDLTRAESVEAFCAEVNSRWPLVHVLVNNPWMESEKGFEDSDDGDDSLILQVYQHSIVQTLRAFWPAMIGAGGCSVVNISSAAVKKAVPGRLAYTMANGAVGGMTRVPAVEGGHHAVRVNELYAGFGVNRAACSPAPLKVADGVDAGGVGRPDVDGLAKAALFLASDMSSFVSGASLSVSGGAQRSALCRL